MANIESYRFVYEFDMKGFFDNVDLELIRSRLKENYGISENFSNLFRDLNRSLVKLTSFDQIPEPDRKPILSGVNDFNFNFDFSNSSLQPRNTSGKTLEQHENYLGELISPLYKMFGVPQGASTSCSLSTLSLEHVTNSQELSNRNIKTIMYADDGLIFGNSEADVKEVLKLLPISGSSVSAEKSK